MFPVKRPEAEEMEHLSPRRKVNVKHPCWHHLSPLFLLLLPPASLDDSSPLQVEQPPEAAARNPAPASLVSPHQRKGEVFRKDQKVNAKHPWHRLASRHLTSLVLRRWSSLWRWKRAWRTACKLTAFRKRRRIDESRYLGRIGCIVSSG